MFAQLPPLANAVIFVLAAIAVWRAGTRVTGYADAIAARTGIGREAIGMLLLGGVTSLPELAVAIGATLTDNAALSVNNVLGAAALNIVILALADALIGRDALTSMLATPGVLLLGLLSVLLLAVVVASVSAGDVAVLGMGIGSWTLLATYAIAVRIVVAARALKSWVPARRAGAPQSEPAHHAVAQHPLRGLVGRTVAAGTVILAAGLMLSQTGAALAEQSGLGTNFFGAVFLSIATTLPELSTVFAAVRLKRYEMAIADVFGTNMFNLMIVVVVDLLSAGPPVLTAVGSFASFGASLAIVLTVILLAGMVERRDRTLLRMGHDSLAVIGAYAIGLAVLYHLR